MRRIADFLDCDIPEDSWPTIVEHCSFDFMKKHAANVAPMGGGIFEGGPEVFIHKGVNGRWRDVLTAQDVADYERTAREQLGEECAAWLKNGSRAEMAAAPAAPVAT
jgi:aryl sulfotransferase